MAAGLRCSRRTLRCGALAYELDHRLVLPQSSGKAHLCWACGIDLLKWELGTCAEEVLKQLDGLAVTVAVVQGLLCIVTAFWRECGAPCSAVGSECLQREYNRGARRRSCKLQERGRWSSASCCGRLDRGSVPTAALGFHIDIQQQRDNTTNGPCAERRHYDLEEWLDLRAGP